MRNLALLSVAAVSISMACVQDPPPDLAGAGSPGQEIFNAYIMPILEQRCASCHANPSDPNMAPDYLGTSKTKFYDMLVQNVTMVSCSIDNSMLLAKGFDKDHPGGDLSPSEREKVTTWLSTEALDRFGGVCRGGPSEQGGPSGHDGPSGPLTGMEAMKQFGDCMTLEDWVATGMPLMANLPSQLGNQTFQCKSCHSEGTGSNWMDDQSNIERNFEKMRYPSASFRLFQWSSSLTDGSYEDIVQSYRWHDKGKEGGNHPTYELTPENVAAIDAWFQTTYDKWKDGLCTPKD